MSNKKRIDIIGGGLAGCALAYVLKQAGHEPVIYEAGPSLASGASGNDVGLYNPRFTAEYDGIGAFYSDAFFAALEVFEIFGDEIDWRPCGALHLINSEQKATRFPKTVQSWNWENSDMRIVDAEEATQIAGVEVNASCLYLARSGAVSPRKLCDVYARGVEVHLNTAVTDIESLGGDIAILACGMTVLQAPQAAHLPLKAVRGQVTYVDATPVSLRLKTALGYGGYIAPAMMGVHCIGSTFQRWLNHSDILGEDDLANIDTVKSNVCGMCDIGNVQKSWAALRTTSKDHAPLIGKLGTTLYVSTAHGSHGILSSLLSAKIIANNIFEDHKVPACVDVSRFPS